MRAETISSVRLNKHVSYLFGVYLTDGYISKENKFGLQVVDKDFAEHTLEAIKNLKPDCNANIYERMNRGTWNKQKQYCIHAGFTSYKDFFKDQTNSKHKLPTVIRTAEFVHKKAFVAGVLDGDGWIAKSKKSDKRGHHRWSIGVGGVEEGWIMDFRDFMLELGVKARKPDRFLTKKGTPFIRYTFNLQDFCDSGLDFSIERKSRRLKLLKEERSETKRPAPDKG